MNELIGKTIASVWMHVDEDLIVFVTADGETLAWESVGDCCAIAHFCQPQGFEDIVGREVLAVRETETVEIEGGGAFIDSFFVTIQSSAGIATLELRTEHNGYYSGWAKRVQAPPAGELARTGTYRKLA